MKRWGWLAIVLGIGASARGSGAPSLDNNTILALTSVDSTASSSDFVLAFDGSDSAVSDLASIAEDTQADVGVQLRAIRGLSEFPDSGNTVPHDTLVAIIATNTSAATGSPVLILRAAIESLGALAAASHAAPSDAATLIPYLNDASRDVRATTARSLGELCDTTAITPLKARLAVETAGQVTNAISNSLRVLAACTPS